MGKKKNKGGKVDARGYGQATVFRATLPPKPTLAAEGRAAKETKEDAKKDQVNKSAVSTPGQSTDLDDWEVESDEILVPVKAAAPPKKIPPQTEIVLPTPRPTPSTIVVSVSMQGLLDELMTKVAWKSSMEGRPSDFYRSDRIVKKVTYLYDYLLVAGIRQEAIHRAVESLSREAAPITLESVLDWLCYHLDDTELPPRFKEGTPKESPKPAAPSEDVSDVQLVEQAAVVVEAGSTIVLGKDAEKYTEAQDLDITPALIAEEAEEEQAEEADEEQAPEAEQVYVSEAATKLESNDQTPPEMNQPGALVQYPPTKDEERLGELEKAFLEVSTDYNDEATNYMRSKHEVKDLEKQYKKSKQQVEGLRKKVKRAQQKRQVEEAAREAGNDEGKEESGVLGGMFDEDAQAVTAATAPSSEVIVKRIYVPEDAISKSWTGKTPKEVLEERCRNLKLPRPSFQKLAGNGYRIKIKAPKPLMVEETGSFDRVTDAQNYVATKALYALDHTLPIHRSLPPFFRDMWLGWAKQAQKEKDDIEYSKGEERKANIRGLLFCIPEQSAWIKASNGVAGNGEKEKRAANTVDADDLSRSDQAASKNQAESMRLQSTFKSRISTKSYQKMLRQRETLPIHGFREHILETVASNPVTILCAETGAGKTTQCPQFLLEHALKTGTGAETSILCTQPRRVAATSVGERVADEMCTELGGQVGYQIRLEARRSKQTRLLFCTTGVVLRKLIEDPDLTGVSHVIVDEVHERQWQVDLLLVALRQLLNRRRQLKVILMSATLDAKLFCAFFNGAPLVSVPGRTFPVSNYFLEDLIEATGHIVEDNSRLASRKHRGSETTSLSITTKGGGERKQTVSLDSEVDPSVSGSFGGYSLTTQKTMDRVEESMLNYDLIEDVLHLLLIERNSDHALKPPEGSMIQKGAILIFLPGIGEIRTLSDRLQSSRFFQDRNMFEIIPMHSALSSSEQRRAFVVPRKVQWAIIVATNIAETSLTIPDVVLVIDSGRVREVRHDKRTLTRKLVTTWCSRASTKQRAGRAGRVQPGICLRLFSTRTWQRSMSPTTEPELQRIPLEEVCLTTLAGGLASKGCLSFLSQTPQPPKGGAVEAALLSLVQVGAISVPTPEEGETNTKAEFLTPLGMQLAKLPVDCRLGKMLLLSVQFRCVDTITIIVAGLSASQSPFMSSLRDAQVAQAMQAKFSHENSDFLTLVNLYKAFLDSGRSYTFCRDNFLSFSALREMKDAVAHYLDLLRGMGWLSKDSRQRNANGQDEVILHAVIAAGLSQMAQIERTPAGKDSLWHRSIGTPLQAVHVHKSSVNARLPRRLPSRWLVFFEKFATSARVSISMTAFCPPLALVLMVGHTVRLEHVARQALVDDWMAVGLAAQTAVCMRLLRAQLQDLHKEAFLVDGVVALLQEDALAASLRKPLS
jgi:ATP-dependent RNA helicase DHX29